MFLHGLFGSKTNFNSIAKALAHQTGRRVSFRERRGPAGGGAWLGGTRRRPRRGPLCRPSRQDTCREWPVSLSGNEEEVDPLRMEATWHTVALGGPHSFSRACIHPVLRSCYRCPCASSTLSLGSAVQGLSANTLPVKEPSPCSFRDDRGLITFYSSPSSSAPALGKSWHLLSLGGHQTFRESVTLFGPSLLWQRGPRFLIWPPRSENWALSPSGPFFHFRIFPQALYPPSACRNALP